LASDGLRAGPWARCANGIVRRAAAPLGLAGALVGLAGCGPVTGNNGYLIRDGGATDATGGGGLGSGGGDDAGTCQAGEVETYLPAAYHPASGAWQGVCVGNGVDLIELFYNACFGSQATTDTCNAFKAASAVNAACAACILTPVSAARFGPILDYGTFVDRNVAGCIELADPAHGGPCAKAVQALSGCEQAACAANCPVDDLTSLEQYKTCSTDADDAGCASYSAMAACQGAELELDGGAAVICNATSFEAFYVAVVPLFCGAAATSDLDAAVGYPNFGDGASGAGEVDAGIAADSSPDASPLGAAVTDAGAD
jgi:hypothetical protein